MDNLTPFFFDCWIATGLWGLVLVQPNRNCKKLFLETTTQVGLILFIDMKTHARTHTYICMYLLTPLQEQGVIRSQFIKRSLTVFSSAFSFFYTDCLTKAKEPSLPYFLPISGDRIIEHILFHRVFCHVRFNRPRPGFDLVLPCPYIYIYIYIYVC